MHTQQLQYIYNAKFNLWHFYHLEITFRPPSLNT